VSVDVLEGDLEGVSVLKLQRPEARNALGRQLMSELQECLNTIRQEKSTRVLVIKSDVVGVFSAGADLKVRVPGGNFVHSCRCTVLRLNPLDDQSGFLSISWPDRAVSVMIWVYAIKLIYELAVKR
jgi:1,4-dihydroxy-2-naphthoyl-CoA synthase